VRLKVALAIAKSSCSLHMARLLRWHRFLPISSEPKPARCFRIPQHTHTNVLLKMGKWGGGQRWPGQCKNVNENKFAAKKKLTKHKTNFWAHAKVAG